MVQLLPAYGLFQNRFLVWLLAGRVSG